jgi:hypothetical protein
MAVRSRLITKVIGRISPPASDVGFVPSAARSASLSTAPFAAMSARGSHGTGAEGRRRSRPVGKARPRVDSLAQGGLPFLLFPQDRRDVERFARVQDRHAVAVGPDDVARADDRPADGDRHVDAMIAADRAMASLGLDLLTEPELLARATAEFLSARALQPQV